MKTFKLHLSESEHIKNAEQAIMRGDYQAAKDHLKMHVPGKSRAKDAHAAKLALSLKKNIKEEAPANAVAHGGVDMKPNAVKLKKNVMKRQDK